MRVVLTIIGQDKVGIIAGVANALAECNINIININQNIMQGIFNMVLIGVLFVVSVFLGVVKARLQEIGEKIGVEIRMQSEEIFAAMHRV